MLAILFWMWGIAGLLMTDRNLLLLKGNVAVESSAHLTAGGLVWIDGMILLGLGTLIMPGHFVGEWPAPPVS